MGFRFTGNERLSSLASHELMESTLLTRVRNRLAKIGPPGWLALAISLLGLVLRLEHAMTFDGLARGSDYESNVAGVRWMLHNMRPFDFTSQVPWSVRYQPPFWSALGAVVLYVAKSERAIAYVAVFGWTIRQFILYRILKQTAPHRGWSALAALSISAVLPISVLTDGKVNPENYHSTLFTIALYFLWRMERQSLRSSGISFATAVIFGLFAGLSVLAKGTASMLLLAGAIVLFWHLGRLKSQGTLLANGWRLLTPAATVMVVWCLVAGWWVGPNLMKYHHPFPHIWDREGPKDNPILALPALYRRPLGWGLPFEWKDYVELPINRTPETFRQNFWAVEVTGTFTDWYNRGFCRLVKRQSETTKPWGGWPVSDRCVALFQNLFWAGAAMTVIAIVAVGRVLRNCLRSNGYRGSLVLPTIIGLGTIFLDCSRWPIPTMAWRS